MRVMAFGTFDLFHPGHRHYLDSARLLGTELVVVVARDTRVREKKGRSPVHDEAKRVERLQREFPDALIILGDREDIFAPIRQYQPQILAVGYDQYVPTEEISRLFPDIQIIRLDGYEPNRWKSSMLRELLDS